MFDNLSFALPRGRVIGLLGENGIGKTTLLRLMADILKPDSGVMAIDGQIISRHTRDKVSFLLEPVNLYRFMQVKDAIQFYKDFFDDFDYKKAIMLCEEFKLGLSRRVEFLSKGNQERLCLLLSLSRNASVFLLDEPLAGLDPKIKRDFVMTILANIVEKASMVIASHLIRDLQSIFDDIVILKKNEVVMAPAEDIRAQGKSVEDYYLEVIER
ncbi:MAG: ATP-binding cassette domain-containing protein [Dehalococcoidia bacterium]|nr:ATP-binding cassette domain-containing protein [Dehalococcoidia bacterium]